MLLLEDQKYYEVVDISQVPNSSIPSGLQGQFDENFLSQVANNYDPINIHEAPFWIGHPWKPTDAEPIAGAWIGGLVAVGKKLYVNFSEVLPWMKAMYDENLFKRCSVEMGLLEMPEDKYIPYFYALGATNRPAARGLPEIDFSESPNNHLMSTGHMKDKLALTSSNELIKIVNDNKQDFLKTKNNKKMDVNLKQLAESYNIELTDDMTDEQVTKLIDAKIQEAKEYKENTVSQLNEIRNQKIKELIDGGVKSGKFTESMRTHYEALAKEDFDSCKAIIDSLEVKAIYDKSKLHDKNTPDTKDETIKVSEVNIPKDVTYRDVIRDPEKYSELLASKDAMLQLSEKDPMYKDSNMKFLEQDK